MAEEPKPHIESFDCWCHPVICYVDIVTGEKKFKHREKEEDDAESDPGR